MTPETRTVIQAFVDNPSPETWAGVSKAFWDPHYREHRIEPNAKALEALECRTRHYNLGTGDWTCFSCLLYGSCSALYSLVGAGVPDLGEAHLLLVQMLALEEVERGGPP